MPPSPSDITALLKTRIAEFMRARSMALRTCGRNRRTNALVGTSRGRALQGSKSTCHERQSTSNTLACFSLGKPSQIQLKACNPTPLSVLSTHSSRVGEERELHAGLDVFLEHREGPVCERERINRTATRVHLHAEEKLRTRKKYKGASRSPFRSGCMAMLRVCGSEKWHFDMETTMFDPVTQSK